MSAFIVTKRHIDALVYGLARYRLIEPGEHNVIGQTLWRVNHDSVNGRYKRASKCPAYSFAALSAVHEAPVVLYKLAQCYRYQSCEHDEWDGSGPDLLTDMLMNEIYLEFPGIDQTTAYEAAPWGIS